MESALVIPVPAAEPLVGTWRARYDSSAALGVPAHVTVLYPFLDTEELSAGELKRLRSVIAGVDAFPLELVGVCGFPEIVWLAPADPAPIVAVTKRVMASWPDLRPYGGAFRAIVPHLTVARSPDATVLAHAALTIATGLPLTTLAHEVHLLAQDAAGPWHLRERMALRPR